MVARGIRFVKNNLQRVRAVYQENCKFLAYLAKLPREKLPIKNTELGTHMH